MQLTNGMLQKQIKDVGFFPLEATRNGVIVQLVGTSQFEISGVIKQLVRLA